MNFIISIIILKLKSKYYDIKKINILFLNWIYLIRIEMHDFITVWSNHIFLKDLDKKMRWIIIRNSKLNINLNKC